MKLIKPSVEFFGAVPTDYDSVIKFIEKAGRTCYKSEDKITEDSAEKFVKKLIKAEHLAMVEHSNFVIRSKLNTFDLNLHYKSGKFLNDFHDEKYLYVGGNLTAWKQTFEKYFISSLFLPFLKQYSELFNLNIFNIISKWEVCPYNQIPKELHRYSAKFICDRGVSHELVRHRPCSFAQESTRYVNYSGNDISFIEPADYEDWDELSQHYFEDACKYAEIAYLDLVDTGSKTQQARAVLPNALKTEIIVTADAAEWNHIRKLRTSKAAHPDMQRVMNMLPWEEFL